MLSQGTTVNHHAMQGTCTQSLHQSSGNAVNRQNTKTISKQGSCRKTTLQHKCNSEGLMHVAALWHHCPGPKFTKFGEYVSIGQPPRCHISSRSDKKCAICPLWKTFAPRKLEKSRLKFTLGLEIFTKFAGMSRVSTDTV